MRLSSPIAAIGLIAGGLGQAGCAPASANLAQTPSEGRVCFAARQVDSWAAQGQDTVNIKVRQDYFRLNLAGACPEIQEADRIELVAQGGGSFICLGEPAGARITAFSKVTGPARCQVKTLQRLTPTEVAGLSKTEKP
jgi:hypothetical protein